VTTNHTPDPAAVADERRRLRELRTSVDLACAVLRQGRLGRAEADELVAALRTRALELFPGKGHVFDLVIAPRLQRIKDEVFPVPPPARVLPFRRRRRKHR
jgi:hypothetical protein